MVERDEPPGVIVRLPDGELDELAEHAEALRVPVRTLLRRAALTAVRVTRVAVTPQQLITEAASALGRDIPSWRYLVRMRAAESIMRWLLARCAVLPLPVPLTERGLWVVQLQDNTVIEIRAGRDDQSHDGVRLRIAPAVRSFSTSEFRTVAAAGLAACQWAALNAEKEEVRPHNTG